MTDDEIERDMKRELLIAIQQGNNDKVLEWSIQLNQYRRFFKSHAPLAPATTYEEGLR